VGGVREQRCRKKGQNVREQKEARGAKERGRITPSTRGSNTRTAGARIMAALRMQHPPAFPQYQVTPQHRHRQAQTQAQAKAQAQAALTAGRRLWKRRRCRQTQSQVRFGTWLPQRPPLKKKDEGRNTGRQFREAIREEGGREVARQHGLAKRRESSEPARQKGMKVPADCPPPPPPPPPGSCTVGRPHFQANTFSCALRGSSLSLT
jgi:hypothetical protein